MFHLRVLQALKSALAAGIAWALAVLIPGVAEQYPYYAPLGALAVVSPTVTATIKQGLQSMMGLAVGILLAWFAVWVGSPNSLTIAFVVGAGVLVAAVLPRMGGGAYGIPSAALFVLVLGGQNTSFSFGYFIQMIVGVGVGLAVSMLVLPELKVKDAVRQMGGLRRAVAHQLQDIGEAMREEWAPDDRRWAERREDLILTSQRARGAVKFADESRKGNYLRLVLRRDLTKDYEHVGVLDTVTSHLLNITNMLQDAVRGTAEENSIPDVMREPLQVAFTDVGEVLNSWTTNESDDETLAKARESMEKLAETAYASAALNVSFGVAVSIALSLQRILTAVAPLLSAPGDTGDERPNSGKNV